MSIVRPTPQAGGKPGAANLSEFENHGRFLSCRGHNNHCTHIDPKQLVMPVVGQSIHSHAT